MSGEKEGEQRGSRCECWDEDPLAFCVVIEADRPEAVDGGDARGPEEISVGGAAPVLSRDDGTHQAGGQFQGGHQPRRTLRCGHGRAMVEYRQPAAAGSGRPVLGEAPCLGDELFEIDLIAPPQVEEAVSLARNGARAEPAADLTDIYRDIGESSIERFERYHRTGQFEYGATFLTVSPFRRGPAPRCSRAGRRPCRSVIRRALRSPRRIRR